MVTREDLPIDWRGLAREVLGRDGRECVECGESEGYLYMEKVGDEYRMEDLRIACSDCADNEWCKTFARVQSPDVIDAEEDEGSEAGSGEGEEVTASDAGEVEVTTGSDDDMTDVRPYEADVGESSRGVLDYLFGVPGDEVGSESYPELGGYRGFWYPWYSVRWFTGCAVLVGLLAGMVAMVTGMLTVSGVVTAGTVSTVVGEVAGWLSVSEWVVIGLAVGYLPYLMRRDYGDREWPYARWIPLDRSVVRAFGEMNLLAGAGAVLFLFGVIGETWVVQSIGEVLLGVGLAGMVVRMNYVVIRGVLFGEYVGRAFAWEWVMRVGVVAWVGVMLGLLPGSGLVGGVLLVLYGAVFQLWMVRAGVRWEDPEGRGEADVGERVQVKVANTVNGVRSRIGGAVSVVRRAVRGESPRDE